MVPLSDACSQTYEFVIGGIAYSKIVLQPFKRLGVIEDCMPSAPLPGVEEAQTCNVEFILKKPKISVSMLVVRV